LAPRLRRGRLPLRYRLHRPHGLLETARAELAKVNPQVVVITDSGAKPALLSKAFDMDYGGNLFETSTKFMAGQATRQPRPGFLQHTRDQFADDALHLRFTDHHNMPRAVSRYSLNGALAAQT